MSKKIQEMSLQILPILKSAGVKKSSIFGSFARGEEKKNSDLDLLIEPKKGSTLFDLVDLQTNLEHSLKRKVDVVTYGSINPRIKNSIDQEKIDIL